VCSVFVVELGMSWSTIYNIESVAMERQQLFIFCIVVDVHLSLSTI
jgi:hypothetical protein